MEIVGNNNSILEFQILSRSKHETEFKVTVQRGEFRGAIKTTTYVVGPPSILFQEMATSWQGWPGNKEWRDIEGHLMLKSSMNLKGHVALVIEMYGNEYDTNYAETMKLESGQLQVIAKNVEALFTGSS